MILPCESFCYWSGRNKSCIHGVLVSSVTISAVGKCLRYHRRIYSSVALVATVRRVSSKCVGNVFPRFSALRSIPCAAFGLK